MASIKMILPTFIGLFFQVEGTAAEYCYYSDGSYTCYYDNYTISPGTIIGIIIGCTVIIVKIIIIVICCVRRRNRIVQQRTVVYGSPVGVTAGTGFGYNNSGTANMYNQHNNAPPSYSSIYHTPERQTNQTYQEK